MAKKQKSKKPIKQENLSKASGGAGSTALPQKKMLLPPLRFP